MTILKWWTDRSLGIQLLVALLLGIVAALILPQYAGFYDFLGEAFIKLINMVIIPLVFPLVISAVSGIVHRKSFGKLLGKSIGYFFLVTTLITTIFVLGAYSLGFGSGVHIGQEGASLEGISNGVALDEFFLNFIPSNIINALAEGILLPIIIFAIFLGYGIGNLEEEKTAKFGAFLNIWIEGIYKVVAVIIKLSPVGIFGFIANDLATTGFDKLLGLAQFVLGTFIAYAILALLIFPTIAFIFKIPYKKVVSSIWDLITLAFVSGSSSVVLPPLLERLKSQGHDETVIDLTVPLGYSFNLQGAAVYFAMATIFIANAYNIQFSFLGLLYIILILTLIGKTAATVPSGAIVVLLASAPQLGLPVEGVTLIFAVDFFVNAGRTALNVLGQALTVSVIENSNNWQSNEIVSQVVTSDLPTR